MPGLASKLLRRNALSPVLLALLVGAAVGPAAFGWVDLTTAVSRAVLLEEVSRITLALAVGDIALQIGRRDPRDNARRLAVLLTVGMVGMWLATAAGAWLVLGLPIAVALLLGAALTPTDPAVAAGLVSGQLPMQVVPHRVRRTLQLESGSNDGLALPLVLLAGLLATQPLERRGGPGDVQRRESHPVAAARRGARAQVAHPSAAPFGLTSAGTA